MQLLQLKNNKIPIATKIGTNKNNCCENIIALSKINQLMILFLIAKIMLLNIVVSIFQMLV